MEITKITRIAPRKEMINVIINGHEFFGYIITFGEDWTKKYVQYLKKYDGKNQASFNLKIELENYLNASLKEKNN